MNIARHCLWDHGKISVKHGDTFGDIAARHQAAHDEGADQREPHKHIRSSPDPVFAAGGPSYRKARDNAIQAR